MLKDALRNGFSQSINGNKRYFKTYDGSGGEKRWAINQIIQGTASYIFKQTLLNLSRLSDNINFLIPMHDAILIEVPKNEYEQIKKDTERIFIDTFKEICPTINPKVKFQDFASK